MFCKRCYADLSDASENRCPTCGRRFESNLPGTYLKRPFPPSGRIVFQIATTTLVGLAVAWVIAMFQAANASGH